MDLGDLNKVWEVKPLKRKPGEDEARKILEKIAKQVQPIMRKHKWRVKVLSEFCPKNSSLLGLNVGGGVEVKLRLRRPNRDWDFIPYDQVLDTMLHELCHNVHGPHNASFYQLWDEIRKDSEGPLSEECEEFMAKGISGTGEGFDLLGRRLGGFSRQPPISSLRQTALAAAEKRSRLGAMLPSGPNRLGGDSNIKAALSPIQAAAMAAERRLQDNLWCGSESYEVSELEEISSDVFRKGQSAESSSTSTSSRTHSSDFPQKGQSAESSRSSTSSRTHTSNTAPSKKSRAADNQVDVQHSKPRSASTSNNIAPASASGLAHGATDSSGDVEGWECGICTLFNPPLAPICDACGIEKPKDVVAKFRFWSCKFCTLENSVSLNKCSACDQWRYSYGAPVSSRLNLGT
ncbi:hypothetical protein Syun_026787 [Stephania yunnanensis]|uniref:Uncharacterized protein n=1 Tax=Stephania yunnanensis TaxID=152371 RepID=A0AAP0HPK3_9MAGN